MTNEQIRYEQDGLIATITLDRPEKRNALRTQLRAELDAAFTRAAEDDSASVLVIKAAGPDFSAGMDIYSNEGGTSDTALAQRDVTAIQELWLRPRDIPKPTIAQVRGHCIGDYNPNLTNGREFLTILTWLLLLQARRTARGYPSLNSWNSSSTIRRRRRGSSPSSGRTREAAATAGA